MALNSITSSNSILSFKVTGLYDVAQYIQGYEVDDGVDAEMLALAEAHLGVDGFVAFGKVPQLKPFAITLMGSSPSVSLFETWYASQEQIGENYECTAILEIPALSTRYTYTNGVMMSYSQFSPVKKTLGSRKFGFTFGAYQPETI